MRFRDTEFRWCEFNKKYELVKWYNDYIEIEKTWCYREYSPRHKWYYISFEPNQFVCVEKY